MSAELVSYHPKQEVDGQDNPAFHDDAQSKESVPPSYNEATAHSNHDGQTGPAGETTINGHTIELDGVSEGKTGDKKDEEKKDEVVNMVGFFAIFRFADCLDIVFMILGTLGGIAHGAGLPCMMIIFGDMTDSFIDDGRFDAILKSMNLSSMRNSFVANPSSFQPYLNNASLNMSATDIVPKDLFETMKTFAIYYCAIGCGVLVAAYFQVAFWMTAAERQTRKIRLAYYKSILRQDVGWFDVNEVGTLNTRLSDDITKIHDGIGDKLGSVFQGLAGTIAGFVIGFVKGWQLTLVILAVSPALVISAAIMSKITSSATSSELTAYARAGAVAEEVFSAIRTVVAYGGQEKECERYCGNLGDARKAGIKKGVVSGLGMGFVFVTMFACYALGFWYGGTLVQEQPTIYTPGVMMIVFFCVLIGAFGLGQAAPNLTNIATARGAAWAIFAVIDRTPPIDVYDEGGEQPPALSGNVELRNINFHYPSRPDVKIMQDFNLKVNRGQTVALVGPSGCGKSTTVQLLQRFYDPLSGEVILDGKNIKDLNIQWLRSQIGIVSQEPTLFATTIAENIRYGREGVTQAEIEQACKEANAFDFIEALPQKYETLVGERGAQLSGGQKQRIAIARALVRDPKVLLLDEATSALDTESEATVQAALDKARQGRTTIVIAHRLSTIRTADIIAGISDGRVVEQGTHDELMAKEGLYYQLVTSQSQKKEEDEDDEDDEVEIQLNRTLSQGGERSSKTEKEFKRMVSQSSLKEGQDVEETEKEKVPEVSMTRVMKMNAPEWPYIVLGCFAACINGAVMPCFAILFAEILGVFTIVDKKEQMEKIVLYSLLFLAIGVANGVGMLLQTSMFGLSGENLTLRLREKAFRAMLRQNIEYFDDSANNTGALTTRLATEASAVQGATGTRIGGMIQNLANIGVALVIAFVYSWRLTLVILAFMPFMVVAGFVEMKIFAGAAAKDKEELEEAGKLAVESIGNIRTVASLVKEGMFYRLFMDKLAAPFRGNLKKAQLMGFAFGFSQCVMFFAYAAAFTYGAWLIQESGKSPDDDLDVDFTSVMKVFSAIIFGAMALGQASSFAPDYGKAKAAADQIFFLMDSVPSIDAYSQEGEVKSKTDGNIEFKDIHFRYPTRPGVPILRGLNVSVSAGETLALVGSSGCGKSTSVALTERFYDPCAGHVMLDGSDLKNLNVSWLRSQVGIVSQEPMLFDRSIRDNIAYGDNSRDIPMADIIEAARNANIHSFIENLPNGYETSVGDKGTQLSGGQKQRIAIARALVRNPKILLLDEATSALDTESERIVQEALDKAREGRTSIVIAHRLSTIQNADKIAVIHRGKVAEIGTHSQLLAKQGLYYKLNNAQLFQK